MLARAEARRARRLKAAIQLQTAYRMHAARRDFLRVRAAVLTIQAAARGKTARATALDLRCGHLVCSAQFRSSSACVLGAVLGA